MTWTWRYETSDSQADDAVARDSTSESFASQSDAESWLGQSWRELAGNGVVTAILCEDDRVEYRMSLLPVGE
jgi:hypothetical protein